MQPVKRRSAGFQSSRFMLLGILFVLLSCLGALFVLPGLQGNFTLASLIAPQNMGGLIGGAAFGLSFLGVGAVLIGIGLWKMLARVRLTRPEVALSTQTPRVGEVVTLSYKQDFRTAADVQGIRFQLVLREQATYQRGTNTVTVHHDNVAQEFLIAGRHFAAGEGFQDQRQFQPLGMHSFYASKNRLDWLIHVQVEMAGWPTFVEEYPLQVAPARAR